MTTSQTTEAEQVRLRFLQVDTANVCDVLDEMGYVDQALSGSFLPQPPTAPSFGGWAFTIRGEMASYPLADGDKKKMLACEQIGPGEVSVWGGGADGIALFGDMIAYRMQAQGCVGAVIDGGVRDLAPLQEQGFPVFARYRAAVQSIGRWRVIEHGTPVTLPGATNDVVVQPGDFILADQSGAVVVPKDAVLEVLERTEALQEQERALRVDLEAGLSLDDALKKFGHV
ncbi:RraA family protein [Rhodococcus sp. NPDC056960]|uniref:RraA family protein n=1 Tax=Rhodococcus sp. NPDC056960 TaxID=3345982 RepID=UPI003642472C